MQEYIIGKNEAGQRLDKYLSKIMKEAPISFFYKMMRKKNIVLNKSKCTGKEILQINDSVKIFLADDTFTKFGGIISSSDFSNNISTDISSKEIFHKYPYKQLDIVYEDEDILIVNKPSGMLTQKAERNDISLNEYIVGYLLKSKAIDEKQLLTFTPSVCNRLDRNTSGLVLAGKSLRGSQTLSKMIKDRTIDKYYITVVKGKISSDCSIEGYLTKNEKTNKVSIHEKSSKDERYIRTDYHVIKATDEYTVLEVWLITGRPHQIRAHLASIGHPVLGDYKYGDSIINKKYNLKDQLLHAYRVVFPDKKEYKADLPKEFDKFMEG